MKKYTHIIYIYLIILIPSFASANLLAENEQADQVLQTEQQSDEEKEATENNGRQEDSSESQFLGLGLIPLETAFKLTIKDPGFVDVGKPDSIEIVVESTTEVEKIAKEVCDEADADGSSLLSAENLTKLRDTVTTMQGSFLTNEFSNIANRDMEGDPFCKIHKVVDVKQCKQDVRDLFVPISLHAPPPPVTVKRNSPTKAVKSRSSSSLSNLFKTPLTIVIDRGQPSSGNQTVKSASSKSLSDVAVNQFPNSSSDSVGTSSIGAEQQDQSSVESTEQKRSERKTVASASSKSSPNVVNNQSPSSPSDSAISIPSTGARQDRPSVRRVTRTANSGHQTLENSNNSVPRRNISSIVRSTSSPSNPVGTLSTRDTRLAQQNVNDNVIDNSNSQNNISMLSGNEASNQVHRRKKVKEVASFNRRPERIVRENKTLPENKRIPTLPQNNTSSMLVTKSEFTEDIPTERKRLIEAYNKGEFIGDELYIRNQNLGDLKINDFVEDGFMLVETIDDKTGESSWKVVEAEDLFTYSEINAHAKELFAQRNNSFPRYIKKSKNLGKEEFSNFRVQGYRAEFIQGLDDANMLVALTQKIKKAHPIRTHITDLEQVVNGHIEFIRRGSKASPESLRNLDREARQRIEDKTLTYLWWLDWNYRLAQVASEKNSSENTSHIMSHLSAVSFPDTVLLPTIHPIGIIGQNRAYVNDIQIVRLMSAKDKKNNLPSDIFEQGMASQHFANKDQKLIDTYINRNFKKFSVAERQVIEEQYFHRFYSKPQRKVAQQQK